MLVVRGAIVCIKLDWLLLCILLFKKWAVLIGILFRLLGVVFARDVVERGVIVVSERRHGVSVVVVSGVVVTERAPSGVASRWHGVSIVVVSGVVVTERAPSSVASLPRLASSPERAVVVAKRALSGKALLLSGVVSSPERGVAVIVAAINDGATTKQCFVGVKSGSRGYSKWEQVSPGRQE